MRARFALQIVVLLQPEHPGEPDVAARLDALRAQRKALAAKLADTKRSVTP